MRRRSLVTRLLLACYPAAWRRRYGAELADLIEAEGLAARVAVDVAPQRAGSRRNSIVAADQPSTQHARSAGQKKLLKLCKRCRGSSIAQFI